MGIDVNYRNNYNYGAYSTQGGVGGVAGAEKSGEVAAMSDVGGKGALIFSKARERILAAMQNPDLEPSVNLTAQEREVKYKTLSERLMHARGATAGDKSILLDLYTVMMLIQEVAQRMRDAMRALRQLENATIYANIKAQAAIQREAAVCAMIVGAAMAGLQGLITIGSMVKQFHGMAKSAGMGKLSGETMANEQATMTSKGYDVGAARNQLETLKNKLPPDVVNNTALNENTRMVDAKVDAAHNQLEVSQLQEKIDTAQTKLDAKTQEFGEAVKQTEAVKTAQGKVDSAKQKVDLAQQKLETAQKAFDEANKNPNATPQDQITASKNLLDAKRELTAAKGELETAQNQLNELSASPSFEKNSADYANAVKKQGVAEQNLAKAKDALAQSENELKNIDQQAQPEKFAEAQEKVNSDKQLVELAQGEFNEADQTLARFDAAKAQTRLDAANEKLTKAQGLQPPNPEAVKAAEQEVAAAKADLAQARVFEAQSELGSLKSTLESRGLRGADPQMSVADAQKKYNEAVGITDKDAKGFNVEAEKMTKHNAGLEDVRRCESVYEETRKELVSLKEELEVGTKTNNKGETVSLSREETKQLKAQIAQKELDLNKAGDQLRMARGLQVAHSAELKLPGKVYADVHEGCLASANRHADGLRNTHLANNPAKTMQKAMVMQQMTQVLGTYAQQVVQGIKEIMSSKATELQADQKLTEDQLDQIKDLFSQYLAVIQKAIDLFASVIQKESQTIEEILRA